MILSDVCVMEDDSTPEQKVFITVFTFRDENGKPYVYEFAYDSTMPVEIFKEFHAACSERMKKDGPYECEMDNHTN